MWKAFSFTCIVVASFAGRCVGSPLALIGGTIIDVSHYGTSHQDIDNSVVILDRDRIVAVGKQDDTIIPKEAIRVDTRGKFLIPGLIDGFGAVKTQGFANAWLYNGITTVSVNTSDTRRGLHVFHGDPTPRIVVCEVVDGYSANGYEVDGDSSGELPRDNPRLTGTRLTNGQLTRRLEAVAASGKRTILIHYATWPDQVDWIVHEARRLGLSTYGELGWTNYAYASRAGVQVFIHSQRYLSSLAPDDLFEDYGDDPFGSGAQPALDYVAEMQSTAPEVKHLAVMFSKYNTALMPNVVMHHFAAGIVTSDPWVARSAKLIRPEEIHRPIDPAVGLPNLASDETRTDQSLRFARRTEQSNAYDAKNRVLAREGVHFLAASGASAFGVLPGSGDVDEVISMQDNLGMTPREALATASGNYSESMGWNDVGRIDVGRFADILVLGSDPRENVAAIADIEILFVGGRKIDRQALLRLKRTTANSPSDAIQKDGS